MEIKNAQIERTMLGIEDHGLLTFFLYIALDGSRHSSIAAGGYHLSGEYGAAMIKEVLKVLDAKKWEELEGKYLRIKLEYRRLVAIGHITKDEWLDCKEFGKKYFPES